MEKFSLEKWQQDKSLEVVTRDGRPVRIVCWDKLGHYPIIGCIKDSYNDEYVETYTIDGVCSLNYNDKNDLFFADEELTELQKTLEEDCEWYVKLYNDGNTRKELREWIKCWCHRIIDLARKELEKSNVIVDKDKYIKNCDYYYEYGKRDVLKDLPKWKKATEHKDFEINSACILDDDIYPIIATNVNIGEYYIELDELKNLPIEE